MHIPIGKYKTAFLLIMSMKLKPIAFWTTDAKPIQFPKLNKDIKTDNLIIGAGITGITTAYLLFKEGQKATIVDQGAIGGGETGRTTAHIIDWFDDYYSQVEKLHGREETRLAKDAYSSSIDLIESVILNEKIECDFKRIDGYMFLHPTDKQKNIEKEFEILKERGFGVELLEKAPLGSFDTGICIKYPNLARFHPLKYLKGIVKIIRKAGCEIYTGTHIKNVQDNIAHAGNHKISAKNIIITTHFPFNDPNMSMKVAPYRTYVIAASIPKGSVTDALYWDTGDQQKKPAHAYHYIRLQEFNSKEDLLIIGGEDHKTGQHDSPNPFEALEEWARRRFQIKSVKYRWSGHILESADSLAFIGKVPKQDNVFIATGYSGIGITSGTVAAMIISDLIVGRKNKWEKIFSLSRSLKGIKSLLQENFNVAREYSTGWMKKEVNSSDQIQKGEGAVISKIAYFRDSKGKLHSYSGVCPHMKCVVAWNSFEKSFDCPCHGSRFTSNGEVIHGPATIGLKKNSASKR